MEVTAVVLGRVIDVVHNVPQVLPFFLAALISGVPVVAPDDHAEIAVGVADDFCLFLGKRKPDDIRRIGYDNRRDFRGERGSFSMIIRISKKPSFYHRNTYVPKKMSSRRGHLKNSPGGSVFLYSNLGTLGLTLGPELPTESSSQQA